MTSIFFVRHAQPQVEHRKDRTRPLTQQGKQDAKALVEVLRGEGIDEVYSSPYVRSYETVRPFAVAMGLPIVTDERFRERRCGMVEFDDEIVRKRWADRDWAEEGGESIGQVQKRNVEALMELVRRYPGKRVVVGSHGTALSAVIDWFDAGFGVDGFWRILNCLPCVVRMDFEGERFLGWEEVYRVERGY